MADRHDRFFDSLSRRLKGVAVTWRAETLFRHEPEDVYKTLVADLSQTLVPTTIMGVTTIGVDLFAWLSSKSSMLLLAAGIGGLASVAKILLILVQLRRGVRDDMCICEARRWEASHYAATTLVALSVGMATFVIFRRPDIQLHLLATGLLFGYCAGIVARIAIRPRMAILALILAAGPGIVAAASWNDLPHKIIAVIFTIFLLGGFETVRHVHRTAVRHITTRLDMAALAHNDPLTGLANRLGLREAFRDAAFHRGNVAVHCLDLDGFKAVNDRYGHAGGDGILICVAQRLLAIAPENATVARVGGDEFVVLQCGVRHESEANALARRIISTLSEPFALSEQIVEIGASLGYSLPTAGKNLDDLLRSADEASYRIKRSGGGMASAIG
jgi:diguanylate cyclase (GGDEF)-like protein